MNAAVMPRRLLAESFKAQVTQHPFSVRGRARVRKADGSLAFGVLGICLILLLSFGSVQGAEDMLQVPAPATVKRPTGTDMIPERYLRRWDPVTLFFDSDTGPARAQPEDHARRYVRMTPSHPGAFTWLNARTLQFRPAEPWPPLSRFTWQVGDRERLLTTLMAAPTATVPAADAEGLPPVDAITLSFAEPLDPGALARMVTIELRPLPGVGTGMAESRWLDADDFRIKVMERRELGDAASYVLLLHEPVASGTRAVVYLRLSLDDSIEQAFKRIPFATAAPFRALHLGCGNNRYPLTPDGVRYTRETSNAVPATGRWSWSSPRRPGS